MTAFLKFENLNFSYDKKKTALSAFSLSVPDGNEGGGVFVSIIGPNGSGKTTLMKLLAGILEPRSGTLEMLGERITGKTDPSKILAYVPQSLSIGFSLSALDFILLGIPAGRHRFGKISRQAVEKARESLKLLCIEDYEDRDMLKLSGGERQKVILTKALAQETPVVLLDEPMTHLDLSGKIEILDLLKRMTRNGGKKVIAIMHDINLAARYSDYTIIMKNGELFAAGRTGEVITEKNIGKCFSVLVEKAGDFFIPVKMF
jgi:iron complex transport system ATP-binding protein